MPNTYFEIFQQPITPEDLVDIQNRAVAFPYAGRRLFRLMSSYYQFIFTNFENCTVIDEFPMKKSRHKVHSTIQRVILLMINTYLQWLERDKPMNPQT